ncbi:hypothetical protein OH809_44455 (plasmid) [Streptomyces sp. NBC_00873]|uniref:hypothetical protein n=1 Tax=unclassified Streptomyces TaxID=2593676 RepID=UPI002F90A11F|nr:hypothetical protein OH809_44455 [Streptomyces sp. NBC_00873]WTA49286.1 hypothetical protein OH821_44185 [Streptomyces sp. NBC_00842]
MSSGTAVEYHWVITLTGTVGPAQAQATVGDHGLVTRDPATTTRMEICDELVASVRDGVLQRTGMLLENYNIVNFQLEPNQL